MILLLSAVLGIGVGLLSGGSVRRCALRPEEDPAILTGFRKSVFDSLKRKIGFHGGLMPKRVGVVLRERGGD